MESRYTITVGIPTYNREGVLVDTLARLLEVVDSTTTEILVADQTPVHEPAVTEQLSTWQSEGVIRLLQLEEPSLTGARNTIFQKARAPIVLFLDDDIIPSPHLIQEHVQCYENEEVAAVTGLVYHCLDHTQPPSLEDPTIGTTRSAERKERGVGNSISGSNHSVRTQVGLAIGGFDKHFLGAALSEDMDFAQRLLQGGHQIYYNPDAWTIHLRIPTGGCAVSHERIWPEWTHSASLWVYAFRHGWRQGNFRRILWMAFRHGPGRKEVVVRPWLWPMSWWGFFRGMGYGWRNRNKVKTV